MSPASQQIKVRKVTHWQPTFVQGEPAGDGAYTFQLILDHGAEEYVMAVNEGDADNLFDWLSASTEAYFDTERKALIFCTRALAG